MKRRTALKALQSGETRFKAGSATRTWGVNGTYLDPTIRARRGERVEFAVRNGLDQDTSLHWHGMHLPAAMDGGPHEVVAAKETWRPRWTIGQPAATLWYHPHVHGSTADHMYRGLGGLHRRRRGQRGIEAAVRVRHR